MRFHKDRSRTALLASCSAVALLIDGGAPAWAACVNGGGGYNNPAATTIAGICVANTSFTGNIANEGTISASGITFSSGTMSGQITSSGNIAGGISLNDASKITSATTAIRITGPTFAGGISNAGAISNGVFGIVVGGVTVTSGGYKVTSFSGAVSNSGTISAPVTGILIDGVSTFSGGISNSGTIKGDRDIDVYSVDNFSGGITNSGLLSTSGDTAITVSGVSTFAGSISNSGTITGALDGILVSANHVSHGGGFTANILNSGLISAETGVTVYNSGTFSGTIFNSASGAITAGRIGVDVIGLDSFAGGITNAGRISAGSVGIAIGYLSNNTIYPVSTFSGNISNSGTITAATAIKISGSAIDGSILDSGAILATSHGVAIDSASRINSTNTAIKITGSTFTGGISNAGAISAAGVGIALAGVSTFAGNISNSGAISAATGVAIVGSAINGSIIDSGAILASNAGISVDSASRINSTNTAIKITGPTFSGGVSNSGVITAGASGVSVNSVGAFSGGVSNSGTISATFAGIAVNVVTSFSGGVSNGGAITAGYTGIAIGSVTTFLGGVSNSGTISATGGSGIGIASVATFSGGVSNSGLISASRAGIGINDSGATTFLGGVTNSGAISAGGAGVSVGGMSGFGGGDISNSGAISAAVSGIDVTAITTFAGLIANSGVISAADGGIYVSNISTFSGSVTNSGTISAAYGVYIGAGVTFAAGGAIVNSGTIIGTGAAIDVAGATSPVTIDQTGGLISGAIKLSANADVLNVSGGTIAGDIVGRGAADTINFALGAGGSFTYGASYGFSGVNQVNVNSGTVVLDGSNSATTVLISAGTLEVGDASNPQATLTVVNPLDVYGTLAGHGSVDGAVDLEPGGTLSPGGSVGTLTINGALAFSSSNSYAVEITPTDTSKTQVNGAATLAGAAVVVTPALGKYSARTYTILTDTAGGLGGTNTFNPTVSVATSGLIAGPTLSYDADDVYLSVAAYTNPLVLPANASANAQNVANAINGVIYGGGAVPPGFQALAPLSGGGLTGAVNQLAGQVQGSFAPVGFEAGDLFLNLMLDPHVEGRAELSDLGAPRAYAADPLAASAALAALTPPRNLFTPQTAFWAAAYGAGGAIAGGASSGAAGTRSDVYGFATGLDYRFSPNALVGLALGGGGAGWSLAQGMGGGASQMFQAGVYATTQSGPSYLSGALAYSLHDVTTTRTSSLGGFATLKGQFDASVASSRLEAGHHIPLGGGLTATPYAAAEAQTMLLPSFAESSVAAASPFALDYASRTLADLRSELGGRFDADWSLAGKPLKLYSRLAWAHDFDNAGVEQATFLSLPSASFLVDTVKPPRDSALVSAGFDYGLAGGWSLGGKLDGEFSHTTSIYSATGEIKEVW